VALIQCSECKTEISEKAEKCPKCGFPIPKWRSQNRFLKGFMIGGILETPLGFLFGWFSKSNVMIFPFSIFVIAVIVFIVVTFIFLKKYRFSGMFGFIFSGIVSWLIGFFVALFININR
jgi:hypothetical protein